MKEEKEVPGWLDKPFNKKLKILIWDDEAEREEKKRFIDIKKFLERRGWEVIITSDMKKAMLLALENNYDVVILDLLEDGKPVGLDILKVLRSKNPFLPIIMYTIVSEMEAINRAFRGEVSYYLEKPTTSLHEIVRAVEVAIETEKAKEKLLNDRYYSAIGELAGGVAHFIKNSLWNIGSRSQILMGRTEKNEEDYQLLETIKRRTDEANKAVVALLNFAKRKKKKDDRTELNIVELINGILKLLHIELEYCNIKVKKHVEGENVRLTGDEFALKEAFLNLIKNAIEAMPDGGELRFDFSTIDKKLKEKIVVKISDTGKGMDKETLDNIFIPFYTTKEDATGFGLFETQKIIQNHGGEILVDSELGKGSTFTVVLPVGLEHEKGEQ